MTHAVQILQTLSLSHHAKAFHEHSIESSEDVQLLSWEDLEELGIVEIDDRYRIWSWIEHQQMPSSQSKPSSCVGGLIAITNERIRSKRGKMANGFSLRHLLTQAKSLAGPSVTIDVSITLSGSGKRRTSRKPRRASSSIPKQIHVEETIPELEHSSCSQITEENVIEMPVCSSRHSGLCNDQNFLNEKGIPNLIPQWNDWDDSVSQLTNETGIIYSEITEDDMVEGPCPSLRQDQSVLDYQSVPILITHYDCEDDSVSQLTHSTDSLCSYGTELSEKDYYLSSKE
mmetsp:Transcript_14877/g.21155  ORF Transcript_14877/g.21155 Transcript_14877/m.21155 type:complete len:286 (+) Transcript_14877:71-928(+)